MPWLGFLLLLVGLATAAPQAVDTVVAPDDVDSTDDNTKFNLSTLASLPGDKLNFWTAKEPPSAKVKPEDNLIFEFLHCSGIWRWVPFSIMPVYQCFPSPLLFFTLPLLHPETNPRPATKRSALRAIATTWPGKWPAAANCTC